jgi:formylglycine-generating enzyme required for sulfatase activity
MKNVYLRGLFGLGLTALTAGNACALITIDSVPVGHAGNAADPTTGYGAVEYDYGIGKYEVTLDQYTAFLNAVAKTDTYGLYNEDMSSFPNITGISRSGASGTYSYSVIGSGNRPVTFVSWYDSARFVNWLHNGQPTGLQAVGTTESGAYTLNGNTELITRNAGWKYSLPSEDEWYKAAYHQPLSLGGDSDNYWLYPTRSNMPPYSTNNVGGSTIYSSGQQDAADVGSSRWVSGFYGTFDQAGNVWEWNDATIGSDRGLRGGAWDFIVDKMRSSDRCNLAPASEGNVIGFRVAINASELFCSPHQAKAIATLVGNGVDAATMLDSGCGYTNTPGVRIIGGGGSGATATANMANGSVTGLIMTRAGSGYTNAPKIYIESPPFVPTVGIAVSRVNVTQRVRVNHNYVLESSFDLVGWTPTGPAFKADSEEITTEFVVNQAGQFFRLREVP